ncbi:prolipoprotein diacylglyceryl transferase [Berryella wangjianweii]|uniref:Phosphatidylglycerol--prolipoprotein diacylglyceryl transferase n=1 Tax=Berryella wangjianweii TaxID=2734634 RepID=A0A6M8J137_9ACTN|nr:prolipoprotein diacylglyceryl transferase [Berryella wangjianweii]NPD32217.1 prolipoprotein diacylglyceryl transferase [Eggerthellaceae bacterium zg-997]QKF07224.1 prolipoprotein diacylglyceryl transferase [Berryella wangjianweii]
MLNDLYHALDPVAFSIGPLTVRWYGIAYMLGFACAAPIIARTARRWKINVSMDALSTIVFFVVLGVIVGGRLGYAVFYGNGYFFEHPAEILALGKGGMSFHGGLIGVLVGGAIAARLTRIPFLTLGDLGAIAAPVGLFFGRCANFVNGELWGAPTDAPWGVVFGGAAGMVARHPTQLYEATLEGIVLFAVLMVLAHRAPWRPRGLFLGAFLTLYGCARFAVEFVRLPDEQLGYLYGGWLTMGQVLSVPLVLAGVALIAFALIKRLPQEGAPTAGLPDASDDTDASHSAAA